MSENQNRDYSRFDNMTTEELEDILRLDASAPEGEESDTELLLYVMGVLADRKKNNSTGKTALEAWESFQQNYLPDDELFPEDKPKHSGSRKTVPWLRRMVAAAAVVALLVCVPVTANAFSWEDLWNIVAHWAKETFSFVSGDAAEVTEPDAIHRGGNSLMELLEDSNQNAGIIPTWIPDGFELEKIEKDITPAQEVYRASYLNGKRQLRIRIKSFSTLDPFNVEIEGDILEKYVVAGVEYYIFENVEQLRAVWIVDSYECNISGDISLEEIKKMIDSIEKG